ncbi:MAG: SMC-Scp complex subunit ScpB [Planctomycetes bacterium]|nr:SMC-Scp complex subunit ScpB [Planctomycetota bacterium]
MAKPRKSEEEIKPYVEAILFAADRPIPPAKISRAIEGADVRSVRKCIGQLNREYEESRRSFQIEEIAEGYQVLTRPEFWKVVSKIRQTRTESKLSPASLETLAIVAYKQPVLRADIEAIRGVQSGELLRGLLERGFVKIVGRLDTIGRPILYGTTRRFLEQLGLSTIKHLPRAEQLRPHPQADSAASSPIDASPEPPPATAEGPQPEDNEEDVPNSEAES